MGVRPPFPLLEEGRVPQEVDELFHAPHHVDPAPVHLVGGHHRPHHPGVGPAEDGEGGPRQGGVHPGGPGGLPPHLHGAVLQGGEVAHDKSLSTALKAS
ncbi:hypothetical protein TthSNM11_24360 (plasmid) [Thermus thermophilus]|uniref:Uncharacterized protein n=1 Tax=Thermus thermophilus TaxID=274 RepID=A0A7R7TL91_THETH|nr:hypothetical protein TthHB5018_c24800 [Thermus thermophilus]BCP99167.1 hypothetical protein TthHB5002_b22700 [Thermus thermophilus]BCQ01469.1 hypothetical protein TthHB5008_b22390 [Thermus thermophilus]BDE46603.1 hypothetical protein TthHB8_40300 [Thermus thermophilus]BDG20233.1 hypothetical protein TthSNM11_24360 [Thermus thermophilus]